MRDFRQIGLRDARGFTLLELLLATALLTVLMVGILAVVADFGASKRALRSLQNEQDQTPGAAMGLDELTLASVVRLWQDDLMHAQSIDTRRANEVSLTGYGSLNLDAGERSHRPVRIVYAVEVINGRSCLIRRQTLLDMPASQNVRRDLVCCGVQRFTLARLIVVPVTATGSAGSSTTIAPATQPQTAGSQWSLRLWVQGQETPLLEQTLHLAVGGNS